MDGAGSGKDPDALGRLSSRWFTGGRPWLPLDPGYPSYHVEGLRNDPIFILMLCRRLIELRQHLALSIGREQARSPKAECNGGNSIMCWGLPIQESQSEQHTHANSSAEPALS